MTKRVEQLAKGLGADLKNIEMIWTIYVSELKLTGNYVAALQKCEQMLSPAEKRLLIIMSFEQISTKMDKVL